MLISYLTFVLELEFCTTLYSPMTLMTYFLWNTSVNTVVQKWYQIFKEWYNLIFLSSIKGFWTKHLKLYKKFIIQINGVQWQKGVFHCQNCQLSKLFSTVQFNAGLRLECVLFNCFIIFFLSKKLCLSYIFTTIYRKRPLKCHSMQPKSLVRHI